MPANLPSVGLVIKERVRQIRVKGFTAENDDKRRDGSILEAVNLILDDDYYKSTKGIKGKWIVWFQKLAVHVHRKYRRNKKQRLVTAAALICAEIDRLERLDAKRKTATRNKAKRNR